MNPELRTVEILLVEDSPSDRELTLEALREAKGSTRLHHVDDGVQALRFLRREVPFAQAPRPDLILLDLNLPRKDGREVLIELKSDESLKSIPVIILTSSRTGEDIARSFELRAHGYVSKPLDFGRLVEAVRAIDSFRRYAAAWPGGTGASAACSCDGTADEAP